MNNASNTLATDMPPSRPLVASPEGRDKGVLSKEPNFKSAPGLSQVPGPS
jgi:hypothetical protein